MEVLITNTILNPVFGTLVFGWMYSMYYIEKKYWTGPVNNSASENVQSQVTMEEERVPQVFAVLEEA